MHPVPTIPWTPPSVRTFFPPSRVHSIPHHRPHLATPLARAHHRSCLITAHSGPPAWTFDVIHDIILLHHRHQWLHSFVIIASSWHVYDIMIWTLVLDSLEHVSDSTLMPHHIHSSYTFHIHLHHWSLPPVSHRSLLYRSLTTIFPFLVLVTLLGFDSSHTFTLSILSLFSLPHTGFALFRLHPSLSRPLFLYR